MSDKVLRQARAEQSKEDLSQAQYQFERGGANVMGEKFHVFDEQGNKKQAQDVQGNMLTDQHGNAIYEWGKDAMSIEAVKGAKAVNARSGAVVADGSEGSQRAAAMNAAQQGLIEPLRAVQAEVGQRQAQAQQLAQAGDTAGAQSAIESASELQTVLSEAVQSNVGSVMPKADDLIKGKSAAFSRVTADKLGTYDKSTLETMIDWAEKEGTPEQIANLTSQLDTYISDPKRYGSQSAEALKAVKSRISSVQVNDPDPQRAQAKQQLVNRVNNAPAGTKTIQPDGTIS